MSNSLEKQVDDFFLIMEGLIQSADSITSSQYESNYKKLALFSLLDMLSKGVYGTKYKQHRPKFTDFISDFCEWEYKNHISLQQLIFVLEKDTSPQLNTLREYAKDRLNHWPKNRAISLQYDPRYEEICEMWPQGYKSNGKITLDFLTHVNLFYSLRNSLVHEFRPKGYDYHYFDETEPYYTSRGEIKRDENGKVVAIPHVAYELIHPVEFHIRLIRSAITHSKLYCLENEINPYDNFKTTSIWLEMD
ncbi:hypothetical protein [Mesobacillus foraminis]|uniref:hypothetical protein n=1 Tax=Mesobacillus foraminis TaxID=279826 RepID=UPI000EF4A87D|nr:hypothetical protein [Mesobacillus foraminis]